MPPVEIEDRPTPTPAVRVKYGAIDIAMSGSKVVYVGVLLACSWLIYQAAPPLAAGIAEFSRSLKESGALLKQVVDDTREAKAAAGRAEQGLEGLRGEVAGMRREVADLRRDVGAACGVRGR